MNKRKKIAIVGGGITGLSAAYYLQEDIKKKNLPYEIKLIEASDRLGGKIKTTKRDGFTIERGPDSFLARKKPARKLVEELGMVDQLVRNETGQAYILVQDQLHKIPQGSFMGIPTQLDTFFRSKLFTTKGKQRAELELVLPKGEAVVDQSLGGFFRRRFGDELVDNLIEPLLSGIYSGDMDQMSLMATFPNFYELEQEYSSLIKGLQKTMPQRSRSTGKRPGQFFSFKHGFESLVEKLTQRLDGKITLNVGVDQVERKGQSYDLHLSNGEIFQADAIVMAVPHKTLPGMFQTHDVFQTFKDIPVTSVANVALAFDQTAINNDKDGTGFVVSRNSDYRITACTWTNKKWPLTTPEGKILLRSYVGKPNDQAVVDLSDDEITNIVLTDLKKTMDITQEPEFAVVTRWKNRMPQYTVGHRERIGRVREQMMERLPGIFLAGSSYEGVGVPDCIGQGEQAMEHVLHFLEEPPSR